MKGLVRLQGVIRGQNVKRQTMNAMKYMQLLVRVQSQIQSRRIQMLENQARRQAQNKNDKEVDGTLGKWGQSVSPFFLLMVMFLSIPLRSYMSENLDQCVNQYKLAWVKNKYLT